MPKTEEFLTPEEEKQIVAAIGVAEKNTSGEIRVHIEQKTTKPPLERAQEVFYTLKMHETEARNAVLFYVNVTDKTFAILGDEGINQVVEADFWDSTKDTVISQFKNNQFATGLINGILKAGERLQYYFPYQKDDINELSNEISKT